MRALRCIGTVAGVAALAGASLVGSAMPDLHVRVRDAKDMAAYLATLN